MSENIKYSVVVSGFKGAMGQYTVQMVRNNPDLELVGVYSPHLSSTDPTTFGLEKNIIVANEATQLPKADIWIDFSVPSSVFENVKFAIKHGYHPVVGTTGLQDSQVDKLHVLAKEQSLGGLIAPNFGLSAVLLMQFAQQAARYFPDAEIIEMHHQGKKDAPSGTAINTAKKISKARSQKATESMENSNAKFARGLIVDGVPVHAVRLPGYVAHEQVLFGGEGEALTIRQDSFDRKSFMSGVALACKKVTQLSELVVGLENILD
ncbi:4-hydroxy-tetrahydrodipicolinate reductase [Pediococcus claussenii]|uniref:4-hydroxy-tetrahydrodipicolinate reductase n=1 Tax=Pediococcus claussenii (strain ATCC BAA-344 / DSM 14800 / JCM 18046 / KCTC 3811 / LMG 21948 / P06) TaxID=701521 RepID=G8PEU1_PEDCP|nr:4-hydroxy-tetrahydrodipicolinate reductase [Pediococcus claussenii]AEV94471.1 dihydrodipicolinate reductase [Pediococcus claussenii ATCC BAA-344]ANZ69690.1 4-hydroxy-tetrahydrodipicolinate reductase [Pediococcus claussenii]ANZ71507.1 4-hydroxy-tetrahydrodipicolinate reductase [Pediococcus claussenii]KRN19821.1 dapB protein [Pediococcus claussenii]